MHTHPHSQRVSERQRGRETLTHKENVGEYCFKNEQVQDFQNREEELKRIEK